MTGIANAQITLWKNFFLNCRALEKEDYNLRQQKHVGFVAEFRQLAKKLLPRIDTEPILQDIAKSEHFFFEFRELYKAHLESGANFNIWQLSGLSDSELPCANLLAWFLNAGANHGQGPIFLEEVLKIIPDKYWCNGRPRETGKYRVWREPFYRGEHSRLDVEIRGVNFYLIIEAKINSEEGWGQLERYKGIAEKMAGRKPWTLVYLTVSGVESQCPQACPLSWKDIAGAFRRALENKHSLAPVSPAHIVCEHFCEHIEQL